MTMPEFDWTPLVEWWESGCEDWEAFQEIIKQQRDEAYEAGKAATMAKSEQALDEIENMRKANLDCVDHFNSVMEDLKAAEKRYQDAIRLGQERVAARELVIQQMREALDVAAKHVRPTVSNEFYLYLLNALALQPSTKALDAYVAEKVKEAEFEFNQCSSLLDDAHRSMEKLERQLAEQIANKERVEQETAEAIAKLLKSKHSHEASAAAHYAGRWQPAYEYHMERQAVISECIEAIRSGAWKEYK